MSTNYDLKVFCKNVKFLRKANGLSRQVMAKKVGISIITLMLLEKGIFPKWLGAETMILIHHYFGIRPSEMFIEKS